MSTWVQINIKYEYSVALGSKKCIRLIEYCRNFYDRHMHEKKILPDISFETLKTYGFVQARIEMIFLTNPQKCPLSKWSSTDSYFYTMLCMNWRHTRGAKIHTTEMIIVQRFVKYTSQRVSLHGPYEYHKFVLYKHTWRFARTFFKYF